MAHERPPAPGPRPTWLQLWRSARPSAQTKKPGEFVHGLDDVPPPLLTAFIGFQHVSLVRIQLIFPALVIQLAELPTEASANILSFSLMALGVAAILQSLPRGPVGSRYLCPSCHDGIFLEPAIAALKLGGLPSPSRSRGLATSRRCSGSTTPAGCAPTWARSAAARSRTDWPTSLPASWARSGSPRRPPISACRRRPG